MTDSSTSVHARVEELYRADSRRVLATLIRLLGDFDLAEEALQDAFAAAVEQWPRDEQGHLVGVFGKELDLEELLTELD